MSAEKLAAAAEFDAEEITAATARLVNERAVAQRRENEIQQCAVLLAQLDAKLSNDRDARERVNEARAALIEAEREEERIRRRAMAAKRLYRTLTDKRDEAKRAYVEPFRQKLEWFARIVCGGQPRLIVDDNLAVTHRALDGATVPYSQLSGGVREQIALCSRLACASLVDPEDGVPVVIDDALGFTDPDRLERIGAVFGAAENRSQVIVLTCMPDRYRGIGVAEVIPLRRNVRAVRDPLEHPAAQPCRPAAPRNPPKPRCFVHGGVTGAVGRFRAGRDARPGIRPIGHLRINRSRGIVASHLVRYSRRTGTVRPPASRFGGAIVRHRCGCSRQLSLRVG